MKNISHLTALLMFILLFSCSKDSSSDVETKIQDGTIEHPYLITTIQGLVQMKDSINNKNAKYGNKNYKLMVDLDFSNENYWEPIGSNQKLAFKETFDGNGKTIENIKIGTINTKVSIDNAGLFGYISGGKVLNLNINWICINSTNAAGGIAGISDNGTIIDNCKTSGVFLGRLYSGGIIGISTDTEIKNSSSNRGTALNIDSSDTRDGGIVAKASDSQITNCYSHGNISSYYCGGIAGESINGTTISDCYSTGNLSSLGSFSPQVGGIIGRGENTVINRCYSLGTITSMGGSGCAGGISGEISGEIYNSYSTGNIQAQSRSGGIASFISGKIYNCFSTGAVNCSRNDHGPVAGGIAGDLNGMIFNCYSVSSVSCTNSIGIKELISSCNSAGIAGIATGTISYCLALNKEILTIGNKSYVPLSAKRIANYSSASFSNNFASKSITIKNGSTILTDFSDAKSNGLDIVESPLTLLNSYINSNPSMNGVNLLKWKVQAGVNNGFPVFDK